MRGVETRQDSQGGFRFEDERPSKKAKFGFTVEEVSEQADARAGGSDAPPLSAGDADPGRWEWRMVAIVLVLLPLVYWLQQWTRSLHGETLSTAPAQVRRSEEIRDPGVSELTILSKLTVKMV